MPHIVCITRQFGSMGRPIAQQVAKQLHMKYYDRDLIDLTARNAGLPVDDVLDCEDKNPSLYDRMLYPLGFGNAREQERLFQIEKSVIMELATEDDCVFVGRCVDYLLHDYEDCVRIHVYAPRDVRIRNAIELLKMSEEDALYYVDGVDRAREKFYRFYASRCGQKYTPQLFRNFLIDSSFGIDGTSELICQFAKMYLHL